MAARELTPQVLNALSAASALSEQPRCIPLRQHEVDQVLPDTGIPRGAVVELAADAAFAQSTSLALRACASAQHEAQLRGGQPAWCAWLDPSSTLYAPGVAAHDICLDRLLVIRPPLDALARVAVRLASSRVFSVLVIDTAGVPGASLATPLARWPNVVRRLAIAIQGSDTAVLVLTDLQRSRQALLPVAMRVELEQQAPHRLRLRVAKERRGRIGPARELAYTRPEHAPPLREAG